VLPVSKGICKDAVPNRFGAIAFVSFPPVTLLGVFFIFFLASVVVCEPPILTLVAVGSIAESTGSGSGKGGGLGLLKHMIKLFLI
tara:strand:- start:356 stop:610 length:255 start_codon:yes stop_codon:yes gene_type:complete